MVSQRRSTRRKARSTNRSRTGSTASIKAIVKKTLADTREKKHFSLQSSDVVISTTGVNFDMSPRVSQGTTVTSRIGNEILWTAYHVRMLLKGGINMESGQVFRIIWYTARVNGTLLPTSTSVTDFLDQDQFIIHSDKLHKIGSNIQRAAGEDPSSGGS